MTKPAREPKKPSSDSKKPPQPRPASLKTLLGSGDARRSEKNR